MPLQQPADASPWLVACLCADWCRTCGDYRAVLAEAARAHPGWRFAWVDIEDHADALDDPEGAAEDIDDFPTLLLVHRGAAHFFGPLLPHPGVLARLLAQAADGQLPIATQPGAQRLAHAVATLVDGHPERLAI